MSTVRVGNILTKKAINEHTYKLLQKILKSPKIKDSIMLLIAYNSAVPNYKYVDPEGNSHLVALRISLLDKSNSDSDLKITAFSATGESIDTPVQTLMDQCIIPYMIKNFDTDEVEISLHPESSQAVLLPKPKTEANKLKLFKNYLEYTREITRVLTDKANNSSSKIVELMGNDYYNNLEAGFIPMWVSWKGDPFQTYKDRIIFTLDRVGNILRKDRFAIPLISVNKDDAMFWLNEMSKPFKVKYIIPITQTLGGKVEEISYEMIPYLTYHKLSMGKKLTDLLIVLTDFDAYMKLLNLTEYDR